MESRNEEPSRETARPAESAKVESLSRVAVTLFYVGLLIWLGVLLRGAWAGESYSPLRSGGSMRTTGPALWIECLAPLFFMVAVFFRLDRASLGVRSRRAWFLAFVFLGSVTFVLSPHLFGETTFLR